MERVHFKIAEKIDESTWRCVVTHVSAPSTLCAGEEVSVADKTPYFFDEQTEPGLHGMAFQDDSGVWVVDGLACPPGQPDESGR